jgi:hypothetical protein
VVCFCSTQTVLRVTLKPPVQSTVLRTNKIQIGMCYQNNILLTSVTPVSAEGLVLLQNLIKQNAYTLNKASIQCLERHVQKLAYAAQISFAKHTLLYDQNQMLTRMNNKAKVR